MLKEAWPEMGISVGTVTRAETGIITHVTSLL